MDVYNNASKLNGARYSALALAYSLQSPDDVRCKRGKGVSRMRTVRQEGAE